jgi:hypothetical protein
MAFKLLSLNVIFRSHCLKQLRVETLLLLSLKAEASSKDSQATPSLKFRVEIVGDFSFVDLRHPASLLCCFVAWQYSFFSLTALRWSAFSLS